MKRIKLSKTQLEAIEVLRQGGRIFSFDDGDVGLDDCVSNTLTFRRSTLSFLLKNDLIEVWERPSEGCQVYWLASHFEL